MKRIIIDADPGIDDMLAMLMALKCRGVKVEGITTVNGNCSLAHATENTFRILDMVGKKVPVYEGADKPLKIENKSAEDVHGADGFGGIFYPEVKIEVEKEKAEEYLTRMVRENPKEITIVSIGPLTNIAKAILKDKTFVGNVKELILMGGSAGKGNHSPYAEFNFWNDPDSAKIVFEAGFPSLIMVGLNVTEKMILTEEMQEEMKKWKEPIADIICEALKQYNEFHWEKYKIQGSYVNDPVTIAYLLEPNLLGLKDCFVHIITEGEREGQSVVDIGGAKANGKTNAKVAFSVDITGFFKLMLTTIFPEKKKEIEAMLTKK